MPKERKTVTILDKMNYNDKERFWSNINIQSENLCWEWKGGKDDKNYGRIAIGGRGGIKAKTHRVAKTLSIGEEIDDGLVVMHSCDNPPCCNPNHLKIGTNQDNVDDMVNKGRGTISFGCAKNTWEVIDEIRSSTLTGKELAKKYSLAKSTVSMIKNNKIWKEAHRNNAILPS